MATGPAIATFGGDPVRYQNRTDGSSHTAILVREQSDGLLVWDQWLGRRTAQRVVRWRNGAGTANNDGDRYFVIITTATAAPPAPQIGAEVGDTLRRDSRGEGVRDLQRRLRIDATGIFGPLTEVAVRKFQRDAGLREDGIVGPLTWAALGEVSS